MQVQRSARYAVTPVHAPGPKAACLDCPDCSGLCASVAELTKLPEMILQNRRTATA